MSLNKTIGTNIRFIRVQFKISQEELGNLVGLHRTYIGAIERGETNLTVNTLERISAALNITPNHLITKH